MKHLPRLPRLTSSIFLLLLVALLLPSVSMLWYVKANMEHMLREEISLKVVQNLQRGENEINQIFSRMANISTIFYLSPELNAAFGDDEADYYARHSAFAAVVGDIVMQNLYNYTVEDSVAAIDHFKITLLDDRGAMYAGWSQNFQDYSYLFAQDWLKNERLKQGFMLWDMRALGYAPGGAGAQSDQIALARAIKASGGRTIATLLITINRRHLADILADYKYDEEDVVFASTQDGDVLFCQGGDEAAVSQITASLRDEPSGTSVVTLNGKSRLLTYYTVRQASMVNRARLKIYYLTDYQHLDQQIARLVTRINITCFAFAALGLVLAALIAVRIARPVRRIARRMANYRAGDVPAPPARIRRDELGEIDRAYRDMSLKINDLLARVRSEQATKEKYHYESLKAKMSPHFLFNTLNAIRWMAIIRKADNITSSIDALGAILRYSLTNDDDLVELRQELAVVSSYCEIHNVRTGNRDRLILRVPEELSHTRVIKFILQPAVENCFKHAFGGERGGIIEITGQLEDGALRVDVADNGPGFSPQSLAAFRGRKRDRGADAGGLGLNIIDERIRVTCGEGYGITPQNDPGGGARLVYRLRLDLGEDEEGRSCGA